MEIETQEQQEDEAVMEEVVYANWRRLIKPQRMQTDNKSNERYGKFVIRPLERGFGVTLGNSLRRVLLSSLQGAAISSCRIEGVLHEFSPIPGVVEERRCARNASTTSLECWASWTEMKACSAMPRLAGSISAWNPVITPLS